MTLFSFPSLVKKFFSSLVSAALLWASWGPEAAAAVIAGAGAPGVSARGRIVEAFAGVLADGGIPAGQLLGLPTFDTRPTTLALYEPLISAYARSVTPTPLSLELSPGAPPSAAIDRALFQVALETETRLLNAEAARLAETASRAETSDLTALLAPLLRLRDFRGPYLTPENRAAIASAYAESHRKLAEARAEETGRSLEQTAEALTRWTRRTALADVLFAPSIVDASWLPPRQEDEEALVLAEESGGAGVRAFAGESADAENAGRLIAFDPARSDAAARPLEIPRPGSFGLDTAAKQRIDLIAASPAPEPSSSRSPRGRAAKIVLGFLAAAGTVVALSGLSGAALMGTPLWQWTAFGALVAGLLGLDLGVFQRKSRRPTPRQALAWTGVWVALAAAFGGGLWAWKGSEAALEFAGGYLIEKSLSVDNLMLFLTVFSFMRIPPENQRKVLFWGIAGAAFFRLGLILAGAALIEAFHWMTYGLAAMLFWAAYKMAFSKDEGAPMQGRVARWTRKILPITDTLDGDRFWTRAAGRLVATPLFMALILIECADIVFALDSIPAVFAVTHDPFIALTSNLFAVMGLRALYFALSGLLERFHYLKAGLALVLAFVGLKLLAAQILHVPIAVSLGAIALILAASVAASLVWPRRPQA